MDLERYYELRTILQNWRMRLAESIRKRIEATPRWLQRLRVIYDSEGLDEEFMLWLDRWCRQAAIQFILRVLFLRVLEDRELLGAVRVRNTDGQKMWGQLIRNLGTAGYIQWCCWDAAHLLPDLFGATDYDLVLPDDELVQRFLDDVWRRPDPNRAGWLRFDFRPDPARGDEGFETRFIGDLYQELDPEMRERYALLQTPHFISQFILDNTLLKRFEEKDFREVTLIDPTCGSGHFLVDAFWMFVDRFEKLAGKSREHLTNSERAQIASTVIEQHIFGCDINPYATALARFRLILAACDYAQPTSLHDFRDLRFNLATIDSLIPYERLMVGGLRAGSATAKLLGQAEAVERALPVLRRRYEVVVGNPPYILARDRTKRDLYREHYESAYGRFGLSAPFTERFIHLAVEDGYVGLINSNAFARRQFGRKLVEKVLPRHDLQAVIDLSGAYISDSGFGVPTLIMILRNQPPGDDKVLMVSNLRGEPVIPANPVKGQVWQSVVRGLAAGPGYADEFVHVAERPRRLLARHPWQFGGVNTHLYESITQRCTRCLDDVADSIGITVFTLSDDVYQVSADFARRLGLSEDHLRILFIGEGIRDWMSGEMPLAIFPYENDYQPFDIEAHAAEKAYLSRYRSVLAGVYLFGGKTKVESGLQWFEYGRLSGSKYDTPLAIPHAFIVTHNHFMLTDGSQLFNRSAQLVKLLQPNHDQYLLLTALLNTSTTCFSLKQTCFDKRAGRDPVRDTYYELSATNVGRLSIPQDLEADTPSRGRMLALGEQMATLADQHPSLTMRRLFEKEGEAYVSWNRALDGYVAPHADLPSPFTTAHELRAARDMLIALRQDIRGRMILFQEEMDWLAYEMYGLLKSKAPLAEGYLSEAEYESARLELGQRPFEIAGRGYKGDWPKGYQPSPLGESLRSLTEARIAILQTNDDIALLEDPLYKRRWIPPDYDKEFREAAVWWLAEKLEWVLEQLGRPISLREWARLVGKDERVNATLEVLTGTPLFDLEEELLKVISANSVPNRPEHYLKASGIRKVRVEGAQFKRNDFSDGTAWKLRGKLNIPRERFIAYNEFDQTHRASDAPQTGGPWFGWAGWDAEQRADALAFLLDKANRAGWEVRWRQCGLRSGLRDLLPELGNLPAAHRAEFEAIARVCGIGLDTGCFCQAYREGVTRGEPGVPGIGSDVLDVKMVPSGRKRPQRRRTAEKNGVQQMDLGLDEK